VCNDVPNAMYKVINADVLEIWVMQNNDTCYKQQVSLQDLEQLTGVQFRGVGRE
jgi:hypothetical protein